MKYDSLFVCGHRRAGTHYAAALISKNFLGTEDYSAIYAKHRLPQELGISGNPRAGYICIKRDFQAIAKSMFRMRARFGLRVSTLEEMLESRYQQMWCKNAGPVDIEVNSLVHTERVTKTGGHGLKKIEMTPRQYYDYYYDQWESAARTNSNIYILQYEDLIADLQAALLPVSVWMDSDKKSFDCISQRVGWIVK